ncbi:MAG: histone deacetylase family protein [Alphaproteobacteria bacterium]|nr:histone deacetylase family protein [Alphaproteobacteria bacterium]
MKVIATPAHAAHAPSGELEGGRFVPAYEVPARVDLILGALEAHSFAAPEAPSAFGEAPLLKVHGAAYLRFLEDAFPAWRAKFGDDHPSAFPSTLLGRHLRAMKPRDIDALLGYYTFDIATPLHAGTYGAARAAADSALTAARHLHEGAPAAFALCRPPGHHAAQDLYGGYCYLNNTAIAAQWLTDQGRRVAILDIDGHHGNGTQTIFYERADVLTVSLHGDPRDTYPFFLGYADETGAGAGEGFNLNPPLATGSRLDAYREALNAAIARIEAFGPDTLVVALGVDTFAEDPISPLALIEADYPRLGAEISRLKRPTLFVMEGGYALHAVGNLTANVLLGFSQASS